MRGAQRVQVPPDPLLPSGADYADAFEVELNPDDPRTAEQFARATLQQAPWAVRVVVRVAHWYVLRLRAPSGASGELLRGWDVVTSEPEVLQMEATSRLMRRAVIVGRRTHPDTTVVATALVYGHPLAGPVWTLVGPLHRRIAPYLLARAAARGPVSRS